MGDPNGWNLFWSFQSPREGARRCARGGRAPRDQERRSHPKIQCGGEIGMTGFFRDE